MDNQLYVYVGRTNVVPVSFDYDISADTFTSQIRVDKDPESALIATWTTSFATDGTDGELILTLDDAITTDIVVSKGFMDIKRVSGGEPYNVFKEPIEVFFHKTVTA